MASTRTLVAPCSGCITSTSPQKKDPVYVERGGGRYKQHITFEFVGEGNGDFELEQDKDEEERKARMRGIALIAAAVLAFILIGLLIWFLVSRAHGVGDAGDANSTNGTNTTNSTGRGGGGNSVPDWFAP
mmetsp:Transcript_47434/g.138321  ORF Transcript_47434/g.138321 Transcript_47434/m.138321 type:complete len:130 (-) Transcript_47434:193-582(-)